MSGGVRGARVGAGPAGGARRGARRRLWTCAGPFSRISPATARVGTSVSVTPLSGGGPGRAASPARRLGRRLAAGLELVRTRGIRLFN